MRENILIVGEETIMNQQHWNSTGFHNGVERKSLDRAVAIITICGAVALLWAFGSAHRPLDLTVQLERFAASLEHTGPISPATARDLERMLAIPYYDCAQLGCPADVQARNSAVRARLEALIATKTRPGTFAAAAGHVTADNSAHVIGSR